MILKLPDVSAFQFNSFQNINQSKAFVANLKNLNTMDFPTYRIIRVYSVESIKYRPYGFKKMITVPYSLHGYECDRLYKIFPQFSKCLRVSDTLTPTVFYIRRVSYFNLSLTYCKWNMS